VAFAHKKQISEIGKRCSSSIFINNSLAAVCWRREGEIQPVSVADIKIPVPRARTQNSHGRCQMIIFGPVERTKSLPNQFAQCAAWQPRRDGFGRAISDAASAGVSNPAELQGER